jgi:uncharacterized protein
VPSTSRSTAARDGSARSGASASSSEWVATDTAPSMASMARRRPLQLAAIGTAAGLFSGLFGVGGGTIIVPALILLLGYGAREATGTSLAAIVLIAAVATLTHGAYGNVHVGDGLLIGVPAVAGVLGGTWLQQRIAPRAVSLLFSAVLVASAIDLLAR